MAQRSPFAPEQIGNVRTLQPSNPSAGADLNYAIPTTPDGGFVYKLDSLRFTFVASSAVADRKVGVEVRDTGGSIIIVSIYVPDAAPQTASQTRVYNFVQGLPVHEIYIPNMRSLWLFGAWLAPGESLRTAITDIDTADQISGVQIRVREWRVPT